MAHPDDDTGGDPDGEGQWTKGALAERGGSGEAKETPAQKMGSESGSSHDPGDDKRESEEPA